jgi:hypothetical protein
MPSGNRDVRLVRSERLESRLQDLERVSDDEQTGTGIGVASSRRPQITVSGQRRWQRRLVAPSAATTRSASSRFATAPDVQVQYDLEPSAGQRGQHGHGAGCAGIMADVSGGQAFVNQSRP